VGHAVDERDDALRRAEGHLRHGRVAPGGDSLAAVEHGPAGAGPVQQRTDDLPVVEVVDLPVE
jgi:hypothetical protein